MTRLTLVLAIIVVTLAVGLAARPVLAASVDAIVTLKDFNFVFVTTDIPDCADPQRPCATTDNPVGVAVDSRGDIKVGILGLAIFGPNGLPVPGQERPSTPIKTVTPEGRVSDFASLPLFTDLQPCRDARPGRDFAFPGVLQEPTPFSTGFALHRRGDLYVGLPNCDPDTHGIWRVKKDGSAEPFAQVPLSQLPKGLALTNGGFPLYVTDLHDFTHSRDADPNLRPDVPNCRFAPTAPCSLRIWRIDHNGQVSIWKESTLFYGSVDSPLLHPHGVNGIVVDKAGKNVYVTVTDHGRVIRIPIKKDGSAGDTEVIFESPKEPPPDVGGNPLNQGLPRYWGMDGITIGPDENFYIVIVRTDELVALPPDLPACTDPPPSPCNGNSIQVLHQGHPLDGPTQLTFGKSGADAHDRTHKDGKAGKSLPPLYITNASGRRVFFVNGARLFGGGDLQEGIKVLIGFGAISEQEAIDLQPRPSVVRILLSTGTKDGGGD